MDLPPKQRKEKSLLAAIFISFASLLAGCWPFGLVLLAESYPSVESDLSSRLNSRRLFLAIQLQHGWGELREKARD